MKRLMLAFALAGSAAIGFAAEGTGAWKTRAVQLDLARQMETVDFIKRYLAFAKESGYNAVQLYLEGRVRTKSFPFRPEGETYSPEEMKEVVAEANRLGLDLVPVVSVLGHAENFVNCRELDDVCEESRAGGRGRFGKGVLKQTFCHAVPRTREFLGQYLVEMMEIFPGKNFHVGLDESFNTGFCPDCAAKMKTIGLGGIYMDVILWAHDVLAAHGRRMWMWDDFFEFFPEKVGQLPKDVLLCDWEYSSDISRNRGHYGCFGDRYRKDWMRLFRANGLDALACPSQSKRPMTRYCDWSEACGQPGGIFVQWEMSTYFHARLMTLARATGYRWSRGLAALSYDEALDESIRSLYPSLDAAGRAAVRALVEGASGGAAELALRTLGWADGIPQAVPADPFSEAGLIDDLAVVARQGLAARALADAEYEMTGIDRTPEKIRAAKRRVRAILPECGRLRDRRLAQERTWRPKCAPGGLADAAKGLVAKAERLLKTEEAAAAADEWQLELSLVLPDFHGIPMWTVEGRFGGKWEKLGEGKWKPEGGEWCYFERTISFRRSAAPDAVRVSYRGYNDGGLAYVAVANRKGKLVPKKVLGSSGRVRDAENVLEDTVDAVLFGNPNCRAAMLDPSLADEVSTLTVGLGPEFE